MATQRNKAILSAGLGRFATLDANAQAHFGPDAATKTKELLASSVQKAAEAGFDVVTVDINRKFVVVSLYASSFPPFIVIGLKRVGTWMLKCWCVV